MTITLLTTHPEGLLRRSGGETFTLSAGKRLQIRHNESGEIVDVLDETVPSGKEWEVSISVQVSQTDV